MKQMVVPDTEYEHYPRGRVSYNRKSGRYTLLTDPCILREMNLVATIFLRMQLAASATETRCSPWPKGGGLQARAVRVNKE